MEISVEKEGSVNIVVLEGNFDIAASTPFDERVTGLIDQGEKEIVLDFEKVGFIASTGLRMLLKAAQGMKNEGGKLFLCNINEAVQEIFDMTGFDKILSLFEDRKIALEEMKRGG